MHEMLAKYFQGERQRMGFFLERKARALCRYPHSEKRPTCIVGRRVLRKLQPIGLSKVPMILVSDNKSSEPFFYCICKIVGFLNGIRVERY